MTNAVHCPKCKSDQLSAQKKGFNAGKAVAGVVLTGGVGALAGLHGSNKIEVHCLACGHHWRPGHAAQGSGASTGLIHGNFEVRKKWFYRAYESSNKNDAVLFVPPEADHIFKRDGIDGVYRYLKSTDTTVAYIMIPFIIIMCLLAYWLFS